MAGMKKMAKPFLWLYAIALSLAVVTRIGLFFAANFGILSFDYISAADVPVLDVVCSILTGSSFVAFMVAAGLALVVSTAGCVLFGALHAKGRAEAKVLPAFLWGWATALVAIVCLVIVALGILSALQVSSMSSKMPGTPVLVLAMVVFAAFLGTLLGAASLVVCAAVDNTSKQDSLGLNLFISCVVCSLVVMVLTLGTFSAINVESINMTTLGLWVAADIVINVIMMAVAAKKATK